MTMSKTTLTTSSGAPVADDNNSISAGERGPLTFDNHYLFEKLAHFNRERIPERVVHARGTGAYGQFTLTKSLSDLTIADFLQKVGEKTDVCGMQRVSVTG
jgi:catalase